MPKVAVDLLKLEVIKDTLVVLQELLNDSRLPNDMYLEYGNRFEKLWNTKNGGI